MPADAAGAPSPLLERDDLLSDAERDVAAAFRVAGKRQRYVLGRHLLRQILGGLLDLDPAEVPLELGHNKRPQLPPAMALQAEDRFGLPLDFNLSSTSGRLACGIVLGGRIGVDVEAPRRLDDLHGVAETVMAPEELVWMNQQADRLGAFYRLWTLKEAAAKAHGEGLGLPFQRLRIQPDSSGGLISDFTVLESRVEHWTVLSLDAKGPAALAVHWSGKEAGGIDLDPEPISIGDYPSIPVRITARS